jgi:hypothetical protein
VCERWFEHIGKGQLEHARFFNHTSCSQPKNRLKGALRRCDVRSADDFDEAEYRDAVAALGAAAMDIVRVRVLCDDDVC